ncbi:hypothetical protein NX794_04435 [Streptomyces sp. LP11]|uniref:Uncharacterized protein n=1 Tax=Streptomyces pyxinicus TaxID=2970331 RepID=A0ABT2AXN8_9ACTN|nr:hypothetical protein [Streptomyces sp. LP11]MCS0600483.1 hypothetical protein [Streptomyces sp. LP11]
MSESEPVPAPVGQVEFESARDAVLAVLALYAQRIDVEERRPEPDEALIASLARERAAYGRVLRELQNADAAGVARITKTAHALLARTEEDELPH